MDVAISKRGGLGKSTLVKPLSWLARKHRGTGSFAAWKILVAQSVWTFVKVIAPPGGWKTSWSLDTRKSKHL